MKKIIIDATYPQDTRVALINEKNIVELIEYETESKQQIKGNIYLAKIIRIEPSLQAAFIEYGSGKNGFLSFAEIHPNYYNIPAEDKKALESVVAFDAITPPDITSDDIAEQESFSKKISADDTGLDPDLLAIKEDDIDSDADIDDTSNENPYRDYKIQDVIKKGQVILVQAQKEERGNKGASFTSYISLAGKYCVLMPNKANQNGISRRISNLSERRRLREIVSSLTSDDASSSSSVIVRTAGIGKTTYEIKRDYDYLARLWNRVREATMKSFAPAFIHMEEGIIIKTIRDMFDSSVSEILLQGPVAYKSASEFMQNIMPTDSGKLKEYKGKTPIFTKFGVESQLADLYKPVVKLSSGGYIVINPTEALISIDVNSGKATSERNIEETAFKTNVEAAEEIARQLRLRDLSGLIVVDFIDMYDSKNRKFVEKTFRQSLARDRARIQTGSLSPFGLLEMSRQRIKVSFLEANSKICHHCNGKGVVRADQSNAMLILRTIENEVFKNGADIVNVFAHIDSILYIMNNKRKEVATIEAKYNLKLNFFPDSDATSDSFSIEKIRTSKNPDHAKEEKQESVLSQSSSFVESECEIAKDEVAEVVNEVSEKEPSKRSKKRKPKKKPQQQIVTEGESGENAQSVAATKKEVESVVAPAPAVVVEPAAPSPVAHSDAEAVASDDATPTKAKRPAQKRRRKKIGGE